MPLRFESGTWNGVRRIADLENRVSGLENRRPFNLRYFIRITINPGHDFFDRAEAGGQYFIREEGESEQEFSDRIKQSTEANPIWMFPQSHEPEFKAQRTRNAAQLKALTETASMVESGRGALDPTTYHWADRDRRLEALSGTRRG